MSAAQADGMSMVKPLMPQPEEPDTALDEHPDAPVPEEHREPAEAEDMLTTAGRAAEGDDPLPRFPADGDARD